MSVDVSEASIDRTGLESGLARVALDLAERVHTMRRQIFVLMSDREGGANPRERTSLEDLDGSAMSLALLVDDLVDLIESHGDERHR